MQPTLHNLRSVLRYQGVNWMLFRALHAAKLRAGWFRRTLPCRDWPATATESILAPEDWPSVQGRRLLGSDDAIVQADRILSGQFCWYSHHWLEVGFPPNWDESPFGSYASQVAHWSEINDFSAGDIKNTWELGRFGFLSPLVRAYAKSGNDRYVAGIWHAIEDWRSHHPPQRGPQWKCGQEVALRLIAWAATILPIRDHRLTTVDRMGMFAALTRVSGERISANLGYALSQQNNHGVSEAAGLFTAGCLLGESRWTERGRRLLNRLACELIYDDGSFSQHSTNYHRLMLNVYLWAIQLGRATGNELAATSVSRVKQAGLWLLEFLASKGGEVPNIGHNDGAHVLDFTDLGYHDFRPTVQAAGMVTAGEMWLPSGPWDEFVAWLGIAIQREEVAVAANPLSRTDFGAADREPCPKARSPESTCVPAGASKIAGGRHVEFADGGYCIWKTDQGTVFLRCPRRFRHRPSQCDLLHLDLWYSGHNLLRDGGSFSYNCDEPWRSYFSSSAAHNTVRFDDRDQMPKVGRFLYGDWPSVEVTKAELTVSAYYRDSRGCSHRRTVEPTAVGFRVVDEFGGDFRQAVLRWRLDPDLEWTLLNGICRSPLLQLEVKAGRAPIEEMVLEEGWESRHYQERTPLPVLAVTAGGDCRGLTTEIRVAGGSWAATHDLASHSSGGRL